MSCPANAGSFLLIPNAHVMMDVVDASAFTLNMRVGVTDSGQVDPNAPATFGRVVGLYPGRIEVEIEALQATVYETAEEVEADGFDPDSEMYLDAMRLYRE